MISPDDLLNSAISIQLHQQSEIECRTAINRAYYAVFHTANQIATNLNLPEPTKNLKGGSHQKIFNKLIECNITKEGSPDYHLKLKSFGYTAMKLLNPNRRVADYELSSTVTQELMSDTIEKSKIIILKVK